MWPMPRPVRRDAPARSDAVPAEVDVLIVGCGPAGLTLAAQLAAFPDIRTCIVEQKDGPLQLGQADGIACRTMEMFEAFGFSEKRAEGSVLDQRGDLLEARRRAARPHRAPRPRAGHRGRPVGVSARGAEPGAGARLLPRADAQRAEPARAALRAARARPGRRPRRGRLTPSRCGSSAPMRRMPARWRRSRRATSWAATARAARCAAPSAGSWWAIRPTRPGA